MAGGRSTPVPAVALSMPWLLYCGTSVIPGASLPPQNRASKHATINTNGSNRVDMSRLRNAGYLVTGCGAVLG